MVAENFNIRVEKPPKRNAARLTNVLNTSVCTQNVPHMPTQREGGTLDFVITKLE